MDVDAAELSKPTIKIDLPVHADAAAVIRGLLETRRSGEADRGARRLARVVWRAEGALPGGAARVLEGERGR